MAAVTSLRYVYWVNVATRPGFFVVKNARYYPEYILFGGYTLQVGSETRRHGQIRMIKIKIRMDVFFCYTFDFIKEMFIYQVELKVGMDYY